MSYAPLVLILAVLVGGAAATLAVLRRADRAGLFRHLRSGAFVIFDEDEPVGRAQDQWMNEAEARHGSGRGAATRQ